MGRSRIARREFATLRREKTIVLAIAIQLFIAAFSSFLLVGLVALYDPGSVAAGVVIVGTAGEAGEDLADGIEGEGAWRVVRYVNEDDARAAFQQGRLDAVLVGEFADGGAVAVEALVPDESVRSTVIVVQLRAALQAFERDRRAALAERLVRQPIDVPDVPDVTPTFAFTYTVLLPLLVFLPGFISGSIAADTVTEEIDAGTLELLRTTPLSAVEIIDGKAFAAIALAPAQAGAWLLLLGVNGTEVANPLLILVFVTAATTILVAAGLVLAVAFEDRQSAQLVYSLSVLVVFAAALSLPESPPNVVAKLALGAPTPASYEIVAWSVVIAAATYASARRFAGTWIGG